MVDAAAVLTRLTAETEAMIAETARLAQIDSGSEDPAGVAAVCAALAELLAAGGWRTEPRSGGGLTATLSLGDGPRLLLLGHADTVWPAGTAAGWPPAREGEMLSGPGVGDMKGSLIMAAHAVAAARGADLDGVGAIELLVVADEELGSPGSRTWIESRARSAAACLGLEAGWPGGGVVVSRGAVGALTLRARGRTAHCAGHDGAGASAVSAVAALIAPLEALSRPAAGTLVSVGVFRGGVARQVVPDLAEAMIDLRAPDHERAEALLDEVRRVVATAPTGEVRLELTGGITRPAMPPAVSRPLWELARARAAELAIPLVPVSSRGGADASFAGALGIPSLDGLGPICHDSCSRGERIEVASLAQRAAVMALVICDLAAAWRGQARDSGNVDAPA
jgi:glutamate carboxypeptidase